MPHIAVSVDMLDTGIDIPEVVNLVFFKLVQSKTKFWQMVGRGTRLRPDLYSLGKHKTHFNIFDFCQNLEFFSHNPETSEGSIAESLSAKLFANRIDLIAAIDRHQNARTEQERDEAHRALRAELAERLRSEVAGMNLDNFLVRPKRRLVEQFVNAEAWTALTREEQNQLKEEVAGLPSSLPTDSLEAKQFDLLILRMQLTLLRSEPGFDAMKERVLEIARSLEEQTTIPAVLLKLPFLQEVQSPPFWEDVTVVCLERIRRELRDVIQFIERKRRQTVITDFVDNIGEGSAIDLPGIAVGVDPERFRERAQAFLQKHENDPAIHKLKFNDPLSADDLAALEQIFVAEGSTPEEIEAAKKEGSGLGLFVRSLVGLDREAAKGALSTFMNGKTPSGNQIEFLNLVINHLSQRGWIKVGTLYASPFTDIHPLGVDGLFDETSTLALLSALRSVQANALGPRLF